MKLIATSCLCVLIAAARTAGQDKRDDSAVVRVLDVGSGLCCAARIPDKKGAAHFFVYDTGPSNATVGQLSKLIPEGSLIDLLILSHNHADHIGGAPELFKEYRIKRILVTTLQPKNESALFRRVSEALRRLSDSQATEVIDLDTKPILPGATYRIGEAYVTIVAGCGTAPETWDLQNESERINAASIVVRLRFGQRTVLFGGDAVGRHNGDPSDSVMGTDAFMLQNLSIVPLSSDVIIAPQHGADGGSSGPLIAAVQPRYVIFSAGHRFRHPRRSVAQRYIQVLEPDPEFFRTDLGDDERSDLEWDQGRISGTQDGPRDDDVDIVLSKEGEIRVSYCSAQAEKAAAAQREDDE